MTNTLENIVAEMIERTAFAFSTEENVVMGKDILRGYKFPYICDARAALSKVLYSIEGNYTQVGRWVNINHKTVMYNVNKADRMMADEAVAEKINELILYAHQALERDDALEAA